MAASACSVTQGLPLPWCCTTSDAAPSLGQARVAALLRHGPVGTLGSALAGPTVAKPAATGALGSARETLLQSTAALAAPSAARVLPVTGTASNRAENFCSASPPQRLAVVVCQAPRCWRPMKPLAMRPMSSFQAGSSMMASSRRAVLVSPLCISHHHWSSASVLNTSLAPWYDSRARRMLFASASFSSRLGMSFTRRNTLIQSITACVGHWLGAISTLCSRRALARPWRESASTAASLRRFRSWRGLQKPRSILPVTKFSSPRSMAARAVSGRVQAGSSDAASCVADSR